MGSLLTIASALQAQKLPRVQILSLREPANHKIDGRATEWNNKLQAYNSNVEFFYTLSNDDKNLYLTAYVPEREVIKRIMNGGLTLCVGKRNKHHNTKYTSITFPVFDINNRFNGRFGGGMERDNNTGANVITDAERASMIMVGGKVGISLTAHQADSIMIDNNQLFAERARGIGVEGVAGVDSVISIYNEHGIKAAGSFDIKAGFTCELSVPLIYLPRDSEHADRLTYQLIINAVLPPPPGFNTANMPESVKKMFVTAGPNGPPPQDETNFNGEYTLANP